MSRLGRSCPFVLLFVIFSSSPADATLLRDVGRHCEQLFARIIEMASVDRASAPPLRVHTANSQKELPLNLQSRIGSGWTASIYPLQDPAPELVNGYRQDTVAKIGHVWKWQENGAVSSVVNKFTQKEFELTRSIDRAFNDIVHDAEYPKDPAWGRVAGHYPFTPILSRTQTDKGVVVLVKPYIHGEGLAELGRNYPNKLPEPMRRSLREIYSLTGALNRHVVMNDGKPLMLDIKPGNLMWISDPTMLEPLGLSRPSFVMLEASHVPTISYLEDAYPFEQYAQDFEKYMHAAAGKP